MPSALGGIGPGLFQGGASNSRASIEHGLDRFSEIVQNQGAIEENRRRQKDQQKFQDEQRKKQEKAARRAFWTGKAVDLGTGLVTGAIAGGLVPAAGDVAVEASQVSGDAAKRSAETAATKAAATPGTTAAQTALATAPPVDPSLADSINTMGAGGGTIPTPPPMAPMNSAAPPQFSTGASIPQPPSYSPPLPSRGRNILTGAAIGALGSQPGGALPASLIAQNSRAFNPTGFARLDYLNAQTANEIARTPLELAYLGAQTNERNQAAEAQRQHALRRGKDVELVGEKILTEKGTRQPTIDEINARREFALAGKGERESRKASVDEDVRLKRSTYPFEVADSFLKPVERGSRIGGNLMDITDTAASTRLKGQEFNFNKQADQIKLEREGYKRDIDKTKAGIPAPPSDDDKLTELQAIYQPYLDSTGQLTSGGIPVVQSWVNANKDRLQSGDIQQALHDIKFDVNADYTRKVDMENIRVLTAKLAAIDQQLKAYEDIGAEAPPELLARKKKLLSAIIGGGENSIPAPPLK